jgi:hypothetical protein
VHGTDATGIEISTQHSKTNLNCDVAKSAGDVNKCKNVAEIA